ncbi:MAG: hypothetical protein RJA70_4270 [Pseudomonadota bacterium]|jgi:sec-independent protein translocase protein TatA
MAVGPMQILIVVVLVILLFGAGRLGEVGKGLGDGIRNFKKGISGDPPDDDGDAEVKQLKGKKDKAAEGDEAVAEKKEKA